MHFWVVVSEERTVQELIWTSGEIKEKNLQQKNEPHLNACLQADGQLYETIRDKNHLNHHKIQ